ncbi:MAG TPA: hypothetical protein VNW47_04595 [Terriglobales bacterium]|jgi:hypothetical protein|nr:hypothetical protein [Terriglobales bacterium]
MDRGGVDRLSCVVCGIETKRHAGWFLVTDNYWVDRVKVWSWHPVLARQVGMQGVCGKVHLKMLLMHWLDHANLQLAPERLERLHVIGRESSPRGSSYASHAAGRVLGELAVARDQSSRGWTGSPQATEYILNTLIAETENASRGLEVSSMARLAGYSQDFAHR